MENIGTLIFGLVILGLAWYFFRTIAKILVGMSKSQQNQEEILQKLEELKQEIRSFKQN